MLGEDPFRKRLTSFSVGLPRTVCSFGNDFIALEMKESLLNFTTKTCKSHVLYACKGDACALKTRGRFVTERGKKKERKKESRNLNPGFTAWVNRNSDSQILRGLLPENNFYM